LHGRLTPDPAERARATSRVRVAPSPRVIEENQATAVTSGPACGTHENTLISADPVV